MQAVLIQAHKNIQQVIELARLLEKEFLVYIHLDKKAIIEKEQKAEIEKLNVVVISKVSVNWSGWSVAQASIELMKEALKNPQIEYIHIISGQDWPTKDLKDISAFYENNKKGYIDSVPAKGLRKTGEPVIWWEQYYFDYDKINRKSFHGKLYHRLSLIIQTIFRVNKFKSLNVDLTMYTGSQWVDLPRQMVVYLINYLESHENVLHLFETGFCSDEFWIPTILLASEEYKGLIVNNNHRYILEKKKNGSYPAILDSEDLGNIKSGDYHFGRKFSSPYSDELIKSLNVE